MIRTIMSHQVRLAARNLGADILSLLPVQIREHLFVRQRLVISYLDERPWLHMALGDTLQAIWPQNQGLTEPSTVDKPLSLARDRFVDLAVPENCTLEQTIVLPRLAEENLDEAVAFGLSTWTPFTAEEVYFAASPIAEDNNRITVSIKYVLRSHIGPLIEEACRDVLPPDRLVFGVGERWNVILNQKKKKHIAWQSRLDASLSAATFVLMIVLLFALGWRQEQELSIYHNSLRREATLLAKESENRKMLETAATQQSTVARIREDNYSMSEVIVALGHRLPREASIRTLEIAAGKGRFEIAGADDTSLREALLEADLITDVEISDVGLTQSIAVTFKVARIKP